MKTRAPLAFLALAILGCGGHHHSSSSATTETVARTVAAIAYTSGSSTNYLATFKTTDVKTLLTKVAVTGLDTVTDPSSGTSRADRLVAIDQRPSTGELYAMSEAGILYKINPTSGAATKVAAVAAIQALLADSHVIDDIDFDPVADQLRVVVSNGSTDAANLRVNADTGVVVATDTSINRNGKSMALYMNAITYAPSGALYALANSDEHPSINYESLLKIPDPNSGAVKDFTTLPTIYYDGAAGLDISSDGTTGIFIDVDDEEIFLIDMATGAPRSIGLMPSSFQPVSLAFLKPTS